VKYLTPSIPPNWCESPFQQEARRTCRGHGKGALTTLCAGVRIHPEDGEQRADRHASASKFRIHIVSNLLSS
jgi:hypothetical protein